MHVILLDFKNARRIYPIFTVFLQNTLLGQQQEQLQVMQMVLDDHAEAQMLDFLVIKVGYEYTLQTVTAPHLKGEETLLHLYLICVPRKGNCIAEGFCTQAMFLFQAGEILLEVHYWPLNVVWFQYFDITS